MNTTHTENRRAFRLAVATLLRGAARVWAAAGTPHPSRGDHPSPAPQTPEAHAFGGQIKTNFGGLNIESLLRLAEQHQLDGDDPDQLLLTKAEQLARGSDGQPGASSDQSVTGLDPMLAHLIWPNPEGVPQERQQLPMFRLDFAPERFLPSPGQDQSAYEARCRDLADEFLRGIQTDFGDPQQCVDALLGVMERSFHSVPAGRQGDRPADVSLFDHTRIAAAFASCLAVLHDEHRPTNGPLPTGRYRLLGLSLGRIQSFLLRSIPEPDAPPERSGEKGMARKLRARSFYVGLLTWLAARRVLDNLGLPSVNLLINAGGRAVVLLPDHDQAVRRVRQTLTEIRRWFQEQLGGILRLDVALTTPLEDAAFQQQAFSQTFRQFDHALAKARLVGPVENFRTSAGWQEDGWIAPTTALPIDQADFTQSIETLGQALPRARYLSLDQTGHTGVRFNVLNYQVCLSDRPPEQGSAFVLSVDAPEDERGNGDDASRPLLVTANHVPRASADDVTRLRIQIAEESTFAQEGAQQVGDPLTFRDLAYLATDSQGDPVEHAMLGALKADVDRLGMLLGHGLGAQTSLGRTASLARNLDLFFKGFLNERLRNDFPRIYTVFAGGDDLMLIGPWYDLVRWIDQLQQWFEQLTVGNPNITFSAGLVFSKPTTPVSHLAERAEHALEQAKDQGRARVTLGSATLPWPEFRQALTLHGLMAKLARQVDEHGRPVLNASLVYRLMQYGRMSQRAVKAARPHPTDLKWRSQLSYDLKRNLPIRPDSSQELGEFQAHLIQIHTLEDAAVLQVAAMLTLYLMRGERP